MKKIIKYICKVLCWPFKKCMNWLASGLPNKMCHCTNAESGECEKCECNGREEDSTYEGGGVVIDDTGECESCQ